MGRNPKMDILYLKAVVAAVVATGSLAAVSASAQDITTGPSLVALYYQASLQGLADNDPGLVGHPFDSHAMARNFALAEDDSDSSIIADDVDETAGAGDGDAQASVGAPALPGRFALARIIPSSGIDDGNETTPDFALGPQYALTGKTTLGGTLASSSPDALGRQPDVAQYTFGIRVAF
jgi:hypothetical protein